ncbi:MAG: M13 family metallopeptidase [Bacteroidota bacterium]|nr:M13 family metallopeptidase [Bacteroidota bacterium]
MKKLIISCALFNASMALSQNPGIVIANMDKTVDPKQDFYSYCNGTWQKNFKLPESDARYGSFNEINNNNLKNIKLIYNEVSVNKTATPNSNLQKLRDFYNTGLDSVKADKMGYTPIKTQLAEIEKVKTLDDFIKLKADFDWVGVKLLFDANVTPDAKNSKKQSFGIAQAGYGLGDRDFYYSPQFEKIQKEYKIYLANLFKLVGKSEIEAEKSANIIFDFEKELTKAALRRTEMRDPTKLYNKFSPGALTEITPNLNWAVYFKNIKITQPDTTIVATTEYFKALNTLLKSTPIETLKTYATGMLLMESAPFLSSKFEETHFNFRGKILTGSKAMKPRWQRVHNVINGGMGEIIGEEYAKRFFKPEAKQKVNQLIDNLILAYRERIASRTWMDENTKKEAYKKLDLLIRKVGYPDKWRDYSALTVGTNSYWDNVCSASKFGMQFALDELKKPVDRYKWLMTPVMVNAYYAPETNEITFPAAILQPPFFDYTADDAANYGTMGAIIGHELTHGFDDQGCQYDAEGNLKMWWTEKDYENFKTKKQGIITQFNNYVAVDTLHVNGELTQGENIADLGGLTMAYYAYKKSLNGKKSNVMEGLTGEQRFFIAWAQGWKGVCRDAETKRLVTVDPHSPAYFRAFGPLVNLKEFYEAFGVKEGDKMFTPEKTRVEVW